MYTKFTQKNAQKCTLQYKNCVIQVTNLVRNLHNNFFENLQKKLYKKVH